MPFGFKEVFCKNSPNEFFSDCTLVNPVGVVKRVATVFPVGISNVESCCLRKAKTEIKHAKQVKMPSLKYVVFTIMILKI